jgi:Asp-tRNA(Asn)/Glu-tRNA(Gln) amidotransferase C subunit
VRATIDNALITRLADLVALRLTAPERLAFAHDLEQILTHVAHLELAPSETSVPTLSAPLRDDDPIVFPGREAALAAAPALNGSAFQVPRAFADPLK